MTDQSQPTVDSSGITRAADGTITDGQTTQSDQSQASTTLLTEEKKPEAEPKAEEKTEKTETKAPEKYEYKLPEGLTLNDEVRTKADTMFKDMGLSNDQAQSLVNFYGEQIAAVANAPVEAYKTLTSEWRTEAESHPDLRGKLGPGQEINVRISKALDALGDSKLVSDFKQTMDLTGVGNHSAFIRVLDRFAQKVTEGTHVAGNGPSKDGQSARPAAAPTAAAAMWPNLANR
jgi:hypothetical protein